MRKSLRLAAVGLYFALAHPSLPKAETLQNEEYTLDKVVVAAQRAPLPSLTLENAAGHITVLDEAAIRRSAAANLPDLLKSQPGIQWADSRGFGRGANTLVNMRGVVNSARSGILVLVDGIPQNRMTGDEVHWQSIPIEAVERIEILRGGSGILYGEGALAGVILITTKSGGAKALEGESGGAFGSYGQRSAYTSLGGSARSFRYAGSVHRELLGGYRESTGSRGTTARTQFGWSPTDTLSIDTHAVHSQDTSRFTGGLTPEQSQERRRQEGSFSGFFDTERTLLGIAAVYGGEDGLSASVSAHTSREDSDSVSSFGRFATLTSNRGLRLAGAHRSALSSNVEHHLVIGTDLSDQKASTGNRTGGAYAETNKAAYGIFIEESLTLNEKVTLNAGFRYDSARFEADLLFPTFEGTLLFSGWTPKTGLTYTPTDALSLYALFSRPFKAPNVDDFSAFLPGGTFKGNVNLSAQQGEEYEIGLHWKHSRIGRVQFAAFHKRVDDEILFNAAAFQNQNFNTRRTGLEWEHTLPTLLEPLELGWTYSYVHAEFRKGTFRNNRLPGVPEHTLTAQISYLWPAAFRTWLHWRLVQDGYRINDFNNRLRMDNYGVLDGGVQWAKGALKLFFTVENITNEEYTSFQSSNGTIISTGENPAPPRTYLAGASVRF